MSNVKTDLAKPCRLAMANVNIKVGALLATWDNSQETAETISDAMHAMNTVFNKLRTDYDAKLKAAHTAGLVSLGDDGKTPQPIRAFPKDDAAKPGRKAIILTPDEIAAKDLGITVDEYRALQA